MDDRALRLTHLDRVLYPETGFTKGDLVAYYLAVADVMLPHPRCRPVTVGRFPAGVARAGFAQTENPSPRRRLFSDQSRRAKRAACQPP